MATPKVYTHAVVVMDRVTANASAQGRLAITPSDEHACLIRFVVSPIVGDLVRGLRCPADLHKAGAYTYSDAAVS